MIKKYSVTVDLPVIGQKSYDFTTLDTALDFYAVQLQVGLTAAIKRK